MINVRMYPAGNGDCFLISLGKDNRKNILIDCGYASTYDKFLKKDLKKLKNLGEKIDLFIVTHIDEDHILGAITFIEENNELQIIEVEEVWYNCYRHLQTHKNKVTINEKERRILKREIVLGQSYVRRASSIQVNKSKISVKQGSTLGALLLKGGYNWNGRFEGKAVSKDNIEKIEFENSTINILSPNNEKLKTLEKEWLKQIKNKKWNFNVAEDVLFDDAFEFMLLMYKEEELVHKKQVSLEEIVTIMPIKNTIQQKIYIDTSSTNGSAIAISINYNEKNLLFLSDCHPDILCESIYNLNIEEFDLIKVPHHGSKNNISLELAKLLKSKRFLISTNGSKHSHPDLEALIKLIYMNKDIKSKFYFNYETNASKEIDAEEMKSSYNYDTFVGDGSMPMNITVC